EAIGKLPLRQACRDTPLDEENGQLAKRLNPPLPDLTGLQRLVPVDFVAKDRELAFERLDHRLVDAGIDVRARFAPARSCDRLLELLRLRLRDPVLAFISDHGSSPR